MDAVSRQNKWVFALAWVLVNGVAWGVFYLVDILIRAAGGLTSSPLMLTFFPLRQLDYFTGSWIGALACGVIWGALVGLLQRLALRRRLASRGRWWILFTLLGLLPLAVYFYLYQILTSAVGLPGDSLARLNILFTGMEIAAPFWLGLAQWLVLRRSYRRAFWWVVVVSAVVALATFSFPGAYLSGQVFIPHHALLLLAPGILGGLYALLTWIVLVSLPPRE
jgi:hypothetical protein